MRTKLFLTSAVAFGFIAPAIAEPSHTGSFPSTGLMLEDYTYTNAATSTNMDGVYEGTVNAVAEYENVLYQIGAGQYLPAGTETVINCNQPGYFCPGVSGGVNYSENNNQGLTSCSTATNGDYTLSDGTGSSNASCYKTCSASCTNPTAPAHSTNVSYGHETTSGTQYYGSSCNAVAPTCSISFDCVNGYHKRPDITMAQGITLMKLMAQMQKQDITNVPDSYFESQTEQIFADWETFWGTFSSQEQRMLTVYFDALQHNVENQEYDDLFNDINNDRENYIAYSKNNEGNETCYQVINGNKSIASCDTLSNQYSILADYRQNNNTETGWWLAFVPNTNISIAGHSGCASGGCQASVRMKDGLPISNVAYVDAGGDLFDGWDFKHNDDWGDGKTCREACAQDIAEDALAYVSLGYGLLKGYITEQNNLMPWALLWGGKLLATNVPLINNNPYIDYMCDANTITINWGDTDSEDVTANNAGTVRYGSDIRTPVKAQHKPGKTFTGWRFVDPTKVQAGN